jgi:tetrahydromethanopterin S-methyltransferase subunit G
MNNHETLMQEFNKLNLRLDKFEKKINDMEIKADKLNNQVRAIIDKVC